jgi:hypothetical protein
MVLASMGYILKTSTVEELAVCGKERVRFCRAMPALIQLKMHIPSLYTNDTNSYIRTMQM